MRRFGHKSWRHSRNRGEESLTETTETENKDYRVECQICHRFLGVINAVHLKTHKMTVGEYRKTFPDAPINNLTAKIYKGHNYSGPNNNILCKVCGKLHTHPMYGKHHTKETRQKMSVIMSENPNKGFKGHNFDHGKGVPCAKCGKIHVFNSEFLKGDNAPQKRPEVIAKMVAARKGRKYPNRNTPKHYNWTQEGLARISQATSKYMSSDKCPSHRPEVRAKIGISVSQTFIIRSMSGKYVRNNDKVETIEHLSMKLAIKDAYEAKGYEVILERGVTANKHFYWVDVYAVKEGSKIAFECGNCSEEKLKNLTYIFDEVIHVPYNGEAIRYTCERQEEIVNV